MKIFKKILLWFVIVFGLTIAGLYIFKLDYLFKAISIVYFHGHKTAFPDDYHYFENRVITKSGQAQPWKLSKKYNEVPLTDKLESLHRDIGTFAFLVIKNDSIWQENYYDGYHKDSSSNSFSMAKSVVSACLGRAIMDRQIKSLAQPVGDFFPEFNNGLASKLTVGDLSSMSSGLDWNESYYSPFSITTRAYFEEDLNKMMLGLKVIETPGTSYKYLSGNTQLLAMVIEKATGKSLADYVSEKFWQPMGAENEALWQTDHKNGMVKAYCCIASNARDFARFGKLYSQHGKWNGKQLLDSSFVALSTTARFANSPQYGYGWWLADYHGKKVFYMRGHLGQYVIVVPDDQLIMVRLGEGLKRSSTGNSHSDDFYIYLDETYKSLAMKQK